MEKKFTSKTIVGNIDYIFKNGKELIDYIRQCWIIPPHEIINLPENTLKDYAQQVSILIEKLGGDHMIAQPSEQIEYSMKSGETMVFTDPDLQKVMAFIKIFPWKNNQNEIVALELGSLFVDPLLQKHGIGGFLTEVFSEQIQAKNSDTQIISVVTSNNLPSLKLFRKLGWQEDIVQDSSFYYIKGVNVLEGWGKPSSIFYYNLINK